MDSAGPNKALTRNCSEAEQQARGRGVVLDGADTPELGSHLGAAMRSSTTLRHKVLHC